MLLPYNETQNCMCSVYVFSEELKIVKGEDVLHFGSVEWEGRWQFCNAASRNKSSKVCTL